MKLKSIEEKASQILKRKGFTEEVEMEIMEDVVKPLLKPNQTHLIQTIRKEVEGKKNSHPLGHTYDSYLYNQALSDILTYLTTLEEVTK